MIASVNNHFLGGCLLGRIRGGERLEATRENRVSMEQSKSRKTNSGHGLEGGERERFGPRTDGQTYLIAKSALEALGNDLPGQCLCRLFEMSKGGVGGAERNFEG